MSNFEYDIAVIGTGRVGLPLGLMLAHAGFKSIGIDINMDMIEKVNRKEMPFLESGFEKLIKEVDFQVFSCYEKVQNVGNIIITVGTPMLAHIETDLSQVTAVIDAIIPFLQKNQNIILRSTIAPKTTLFVKMYIEKRTEFRIGQDLFLSFCPERIAEGKAYEELRTLPQIIGAGDDESFHRANAIFSKLTGIIFRTTYTSAELVKLFNNIGRYISFAVSNQFALIADNYDENIYEIIEMANSNYPRGYIYSPGLTAGTCLRKDFGMINETVPYTDMLLSSWKVNEFMPKFLIENMMKRTEINGKKVAVLGYTFKKDTDDTRDSLTPKLLRYLEREVPADIRVSESHLDFISERYKNYPLEEAIQEADIIFISVNHTEYGKRKDFILETIKPDCYIADIWNLFGTSKIFFSKSEVCK